MRVLWWFRRHPILTILMVIILTPVVVLLHWLYLPSIPSTSADGVEAITVRLAPYKVEEVGDPQEEAEVTTTDRQHIQGLLEVFKKAERASEHKCGPSGTIVIRKKGGRTEEVHILPGHHTAYYEYRYAGRINRVDRAHFLEALKSVGIRKIKLKGPS